VNEIRLVRQLDETGCGIACLAMIIGKSYQEAKAQLSEQLNWTARKTNFRTRAPELMVFLKNCGITAKSGKFPGWDKLDGTALVGVNPFEGGYHWVLVVKDATRFLIIDPVDAQVYQGNDWIDDKKDGYSAGLRSACLNLTNFNATHIKL
jgi:ABC-type bacteriocin/lantibiotic exporter with double-glycine peptidase domain